MQKIVEVETLHDFLFVLRVTSSENRRPKPTQLRIVIFGSHYRPVYLAPVIMQIAKNLHLPVVVRFWQEATAADASRDNTLACDISASLALRIVTIERASHIRLPI